MKFENNLTDLECQKALEIIKNSVKKTSEMIIPREIKIKGKSSFKLEEKYSIVANFSGQINYSKQIDGDIIMVLNRESILKIASQMMGTKVDELDPIGFSAILEFLNVISGSATADLVDYFNSNMIRISPPIVIKSSTIKKLPETKFQSTYELKLVEGGSLLVHIDILKNLSSVTELNDLIPIFENP